MKKESNLIVAQGVGISNENWRYGMSKLHHIKGELFELISLLNLSAYMYVYLLLLIRSTYQTPNLFL